MKYQIRRLTASILLVGLGAYLIATEAHRAILRPLWAMFTDFMNYYIAF